MDDAADIIGLELSHGELICDRDRYGSQLVISRSLAEFAVNSVIGDRLKKQRQIGRAPSRSEQPSEPPGRRHQRRIARLRGRLRQTT